MVAMPWIAIDTPSLAIGILRSRVAEVLPDVDIVEYPGSLRWAEYVLAASGAEITPVEYMRVMHEGEGFGVGDWIFAGDLYSDTEWRATALRRYGDALGDLIPLAERMRRMATDFATAAVEEILRSDPDVVAFTTTFMQTVPSLAVARRVKFQRPEVQIVFGGGNCDGSMGHALHRNHRFVDYVVRGEGELAFPAVLTHLLCSTRPSDVAGVCWWDADRSVANLEAAGPVSPDLIPMPNYDAWFAALDESPIGQHLSPYLFVEGSRGCWWGQRHQCTFCGLNPATIGFRSRPAARFWSELTTLVQRHQVLDVMTADNIIDHRYYTELLPRLAAAGWDLRLQWEAKASVDANGIELLSAAGVRVVQFGIESLNSRTLTIMDKGVTATTNVRLLRQAEDHGLTVLWNYLYGFPGETAADYWPVIEQVAALVHLQPPSGAHRIALERFSPYFERPELGFPRRRPQPFYHDIFDLPEAELADLAYYFTSDPAGIGGEVVAALKAAIDRWRVDYPTSSLFILATSGDAWTIRDRRRGWPERDHVLTGWQRAGYDLLMRGHRADALRDRLASRGFDVSEEALGGWLTRCQRDGLVFNDDGAYVALATNDVAVHLTVDQGEAVYA